MHLPNFSELHLDPLLLEALEVAGYTTPTPIQAQSIPHLLQGRDLLGIAQTGTGKTAAFSLPILQQMSQSPLKVRPWHTRALILAPTRELAIQIFDNLKVYGKPLGYRFSCIFGGVAQEKQVSEMQGGVEVLVATPGRFLDLKNQGYIKLEQTEFFVLDEADRMLDMGFIVDIKKIIAALPTKRQTLLFSATMPTDIASLAQTQLNRPVKVEITPQATTVERIDQKLLFVEHSKKCDLLCDILREEAVDHVLVFSRTKRGADRLVRELSKAGLPCDAIHGNKSQAAREKTLNQFRSGKVKVLIATDIAARGIDVEGISHVINFDLPDEPESYVHRIGRTARAGKKGTALSFCSATELAQLHAIESAIRIKIPVDVSHQYHTRGKIVGRPQAKSIFGEISLKTKESETKILAEAVSVATASHPKIPKAVEIKPLKTVAAKAPTNLSALRPSRRVIRPAVMAPNHLKTPGR